MPKNKAVEFKMAKVDIQSDIIISGKLKFLSTKKNDYGDNNLFQILDE